MTDTKRVHILDILAILSHRNIGLEGIQGTALFLKWMVSDEIYDFQIPRVSRECAPYLRDQFPELARIEVPKFSASHSLPREQYCAEILAQIVEWLENYLIDTLKLSEYYLVERIPQDDHDLRDPHEEFKQLFGDKKIVDFKIDSSDDDEPSPYGDLPPKDRRKQ